jgi:hypothetical protein
MKLLKVEEHNYHIIYVNDNEKYNAYRRVNESTWQEYHNGKWYAVEDCVELEKAFNERDKTKTYKI